MIIEELKEKVSFITVLEDHGVEFRGGGNRLRAKVNPIREGGDFDFYQDTQKYYDHGTGDGGDVVDFIEVVENLSKSDALSFLQEKYLNGADLPNNYIKPTPRYKPVKKDNDKLSAQLEIKANKYLQASHKRYKNKWSYMTLNVGGIENKVVRVAPYLEKLFEGYLIPTEEKFAKYIFNRIVGYDSFFDCPVIILRDESEKVIDIVRYRPIREGFDDLPKYLYTKATEKPDSTYLFPLQAQMQKIMMSEGYCFIGEGLKNAINASMMGIPFISIEGAGNIKPELIEFLKSPRMDGISLLGAFDGDQAGVAAYRKINKQIPMDNQFTFDSGVDFADWLREVKQCQVSEIK